MPPFSIAAGENGELTVEDKSRDRHERESERRGERELGLIESREKIECNCKFQVVFYCYFTIGRTFCMVSI